MQHGSARSLGIALAALFALGAWSACAQTIKWHKGQKAALKAAAESQKPIMVDVYADWCGWCKRLDQTTFRAARVVQLAAEFEPAKVDADKTKWHKQFGVSGLPTILFLDPDGNLIHKVTGYKDATGFEGEMQVALRSMAAYKQLKELEAKLKEEPESADLQFQFGHACYLAGRLDEAKEALSKASELDPEDETGHAEDIKLDLMLMGLRKGDKLGVSDSYKWLSANQQHKRTAEAAYFMGESYLAHKQVNEAFQMFNMAAQKGRGTEWAQKAMQQLVNFR